jgi:hypothetical protein
MGAYEAPVNPPAPAAATLSPASVDFGSRPGGSNTGATVTVTDSGGVPLQISGDTLAAASTFFSKTSDTCAGSTLAPGATCAIGLSFHAGAPGTFTGRLDVRDTAGTQSVPLTAVGSMGRISVSPSSLDFGSVSFLGGQSAPRTVNIANTGNAPLHVGAISVQGVNAADFRIQSNPCSNAAVPAGGSCSLTLVFRPGGSGGRSAALSIPSDDVQRTASVALSGTGVLL